MDPINNPFSPGAGSPPPEIVGRESVLEQTRILLGRVKAKRPEKSILLTGLRGVGKTVLLNEMEKMASIAGYCSISIEANEDAPLPLVLAPHLRQLLFTLNRMAGASDKVRRGLAVLKSFIGAIKISIGEVDFGLDITPEHGTADSGNLEVDLVNLLIALAEAAEDKHVPVALIIDEIQFFKEKDLGALIMAMHKMQQRQLPLVLMAAGLPTLPGLAGNSKSYAERLFNYVNIGPLTDQDVYKTLQVQDIAFTEEAVAEIIKLTNGYPYFVQEWGYQAWNHATEKTITISDIGQISSKVVSRLDSNFFRVRFDRLTNGEKNYLRAMAFHRKTGDVATALNKKVSSLGPTRANLIHKGMIYSHLHGDITFTVPLFGEFILRAMPSYLPK